MPAHPRKKLERCRTGTLKRGTWPSRYTSISPISTATVLNKSTDFYNYTVSLFVNGPVLLSGLVRLIVFSHVFVDKFLRLHYRFSGNGKIILVHQLQRVRIIMKQVLAYLPDTLPLVPCFFLYLLQGFLLKIQVYSMFKKKVFLESLDIIIKQ